MFSFQTSRDQPGFGVIPKVMFMRDDPKVIFLGEKLPPEQSQFEAESVCVAGPIALSTSNICHIHEKIFFKLRSKGFPGYIYFPERRVLSLPEKELTSSEITAWKMQSLSEATHSIFWFPDLFSEQKLDAYIELLFALGKHSHNGAAKKIHVGRPGKKLKNVQVQDWLTIKEIPIHENLDQLCSAAVISTTNN